jgi:hypothetical protein
MIWNSPGTYWEVFECKQIVFVEISGNIPSRMKRRWSLSHWQNRLAWEKNLYVTVIPDRAGRRSGARRLDTGRLCDSSLFFPAGGNTPPKQDCWFKNKFAANTAIDAIYLSRTTTNEIYQGSDGRILMAHVCDYRIA